MAINQLGGGSAALEAKFNAKGDILVATANDVSAAVSVGANGTILVADSSQAAGVAWAANAPDVATTKGDLITRTDSGYARIGVGTNGQGLLADSSTATGLVWGAPASVAYYEKFQVFTSSGTWTAPTSVTSVDVLAIGAGGGGAAGARIGAGNIASPGGGGAGGNCVFIKQVPVTSGVTYTVTVGAGGLGGTGLNVFQSSANTTQTTGPTGSNGGDSSFGSVNTVQYVLAKGGRGGGTQNVSGGFSNSGNRYGQYSVGTGDNRQGTFWFGMQSESGYQNNIRWDQDTTPRTRWFSQNSEEDTSEYYVYYGPNGSMWWPGGSSTSDLSNTTVASRLSGQPFGKGNNGTRDLTKNSNSWYRRVILPMLSIDIAGAPSAAVNGSTTAGATAPSGFGSGGGRGGVANTALATSTQGDMGNVGSGAGGGAGFNGNAGNGGNAGANTGSGGGGGGGAFGAATYISGTGGTGGSGVVVLGWVGA
jgi:hypothetical protein